MLLFTHAQISRSVQLNHPKLIVKLEHGQGIALHRKVPDHDDIIKWKHFPHDWPFVLRYWPFVQGIHLSLVNSPHIGQWRGALMFSLICVWINGCVNNHDAGDLRCHHTHYDVTVMVITMPKSQPNCVSNKGSCMIIYIPQKYMDVYIYSLITDI